MLVGVAAGALVTAGAALLLLWVDGWVAAMVGVLHTHDARAVLAVVAALFLVHAVLVYVAAEAYDKRGRKARKATRR